MSNRNESLVIVIGLTAIVLALTGCKRDPVNRAMRALAAGNPALAESLLAHGADSADPSLLANLALARMKLGQIDEAMTGFRRSADLVPDDPRPLEFMAAMAAEDSRWRMSHQLLLEASRRNPRSPRIQTALATIELRTYGAQAAVTRLTQVLASAPNYSPALFNLALIQKETLNNPSESIRLLERFLSTSGDSERLAVARQILSELRTSAPMQGNSTTVRSQASAERPSRRSNGTALYNQGVKHHSAGNLDQASEAYRNALEIDPSMANAHYNLGLICKSRNNLPEARVSFEKALELQPEFSDARYMLGCILKDEKKPLAAVEQWETLISSNPNHAQAFHALGLLYKDSPAKQSEARRCFEKYLELTPGGSQAQVVREWLKSHD